MKSESKRFENMVHPLTTGSVRVNLRELFFDGFEVSKDVEEDRESIFNHYFSDASEQNSDELKKPESD